MMKNPQSRVWKGLTWILLLATAGGYVMLTLMAYAIPFGLPRPIWNTAIVITAVCGAGGFLMLNETWRTRPDRCKPS